ncbi:FadR family transcriptional regulator [Metabacillus sediminilitoris]|uniref:FadR family transcriptional regulator n=1 Tax=Metabacillus sediminilitoris TaxID=2567941 RepID=A0A4S4C2S8_9BACI|nr:GntR family transcriptional regulator [Metabacillus sediminilitoris]THF81938.1 FadR family transcriptional regulator [Metabacillus sediminilitoris]
MSDSSLTTTQSKVYIEILRHIRAYIAEKQLSYGDKIPSEREFAEKLKVGRSSVREALRALELLGMIETRRGEGTFLKDFREHSLIELLGTFILEDSKAVGDIIEMNSLLEHNALQLILKGDQERELKLLAAKLNNNSVTRYEFMKELILLTNNYLLFRIWSVLNEYVTFVCENDQEKVYPNSNLEMLVTALLKKEQKEVLAAYEAVSLK